MEQVQVSVLPKTSVLPPPTVGSDTPIEKTEQAIRGSESSDFNEKEDLKSEVDAGSEDVIIRTGADAANHLLPLRDDGDASLTVRSIVLGTLVAAFQASLNQIYSFKPTGASISGSFIVLIIWFLGRAWAAFLPRGDLLEQRWLANKGTGRRPWWLRAAILVNPSPFGLKEHAVAAITASSASNGTASISVFAVQNLFYSNRLTATTVVLSTLSIGLFGYGLTGLLRPMTVWHVEAVYWSNIPLVSVLQSLHWDNLRSSKPLRAFWIAFGGMSFYEVFPAYIFPWLNSVSIPCLAAMNATGSKAAVLTNLFGGSLSNEGLGILNFTFDWQYITSGSTSLPLIYQVNSALGIFICYFAMIAVYYGNAWNAKSFPFMATTLRAEDGSRYPSRKVFIDGVLNTTALETYGLPHLAGTYTWALVVGNAAIGALIGHCVFFWGKGIVGSMKRALKGQHDDRHHAAMAKYKEAPWYWYIVVLVVAFVFGLVAVLKEDISLPAWAYVVSLLLGAIIAPFSTLLFSRFGNGIATNSLMKMLAGVIIPGRPLGNLYFSAWSHSVIAQSLNLASDLKLGEYLKIPPRVMFLTQIWGTVFGAFVNYVVMISVLNAHRDLLTDTNGNYAWSGQGFQSLDTQATTWALSRYLYTVGAQYVLVPVGLIIGFGLVLVHRVFSTYVPRVGRFSTRDLNIPTVLMYSGWMGYNQTQTCVILSSILAGFFVQYYLRNFRPRIYKDYSYLVTAGLDGGSLLVIFILSFAVGGAAGPAISFPAWWGNPAEGFPDHCPDPST